MLCKICQLNEIKNLVGTCFQKFGTKHSKKISITKDHRIPNKSPEYKIFELKYGSTKLLGNRKYNQVKLVLAAFSSAYFYQVSFNYIKQTRNN